MSDAYVGGFVEKCTELGVDAEKLLKQADSYSRGEAALKGALGAPKGRKLRASGHGLAGQVAGSVGGGALGAGASLGIQALIRLLSRGKVKALPGAAGKAIEGGTRQINPAALLGGIGGAGVGNVVGSIEGVHHGAQPTNLKEKLQDLLRR